MKRFFLPVIAAVLPFLPACFNKNSTEGIPPVSGFNLKKYMGTWYEIARYPHSFEKGLTHVSAEYILKPDNTVEVINRGWKNGTPKTIRGIAKKTGPADSGEMKVSFFRPFYGVYKIIYLNREYSLAAVTSSNKDFLWILARKREISQTEYNALIKFLSDYGFQEDRLILVNQK